MKKSKKKNYAIIVLVVLLLALAIGYAAFSTTLTINGTATGTATWDVKFTNGVLLDANGNDVTTTYATDKKVTVTDTAVTAKVKLSYPGDAVNLRVTIANQGTLDAELTAYNVQINSGDTDVTVTPAKTSGTTGEVVEAGNTCTQDFVIKWDKDSEKTSVSKNFTVTFTYTQKTDEVNITPAHTDA